MCLSEQNSSDSRWALIRMVKTFDNSYTALCNQKLSPLGLTVAQCEVLCFLYDHLDGFVETKELLESLQIKPSSMAMHLKKLREKGFIRRSAHGRNKRISLTVHALEIQSQVMYLMQELENISFGRTTQVERRAAQSTLQDMIQSIDDHIAAAR